jgi:hypothetical protein
MGFILMLAALFLIIIGRDKIKTAFVAYTSDTKYLQSGQTKSINPPRKNKIGDSGFTMALLGLACVVVYFCVQSVRTGEGWELLGWVLFLGMGALFFGFYGMVLSLVGIFNVPRKFAIAGLCISLIPIFFAVKIWILLTS